MKDLLERTNTTINRRDRRRILVGVCTIALSSVAWHLAHPAMIRTAAQYSLGCSGRNALVVAALRSVGLSVAPPNEPFQSYRRPAPGCVVWQLGDHPQQATNRASITTFGLADAYFSLQGTWCGREHWCFPCDTPADWDNDSSYEVLLFIPGWIQDDRILDRFGVVRVHPDQNELLVLFTIDSPALHLPAVSGDRFYVRWQESGSGSTLVVDLVATTPWPNYTEKVKKRLITFIWSPTHHTLVPLSPLDDARIRIWQPPDGQPFRFSPNTPIEDVFDQCLPLPNSPSATPPSTSPTTVPQPADQ